MRTPTELTELFRSRGLKVTPQRQCIFRLLHGDEAHPTAETVYQAALAEMPTMSLKTVYTTLSDLAEMGEISQLDVGTGASRFDPNTDTHHHLVCRVCGKVRDLTMGFDGLELPRGEQRGFSIDSAEVVFRGVCDSCSHHDDNQGNDSNERNPWPT